MRIILACHPLTRPAGAIPLDTDLQRRFITLLQQHRGIVLKVAASYCHDRDDRAELAQEIATQLWRAFPG